MGSRNLGFRVLGENLIPVTLTGLAATSAVGSLTVVAKANVTPSSQVGTGAVGTPTFDCEANVSPTGQSGTSALGSVTIDAEANVTLYLDNLLQVL